MINTLRTRLLASYIAILLVTLTVIGVALVVFLRSRPLPADPIINDLTATLLDVRVWQELRGPNQAMGMGRQSSGSNDGVPLRPRDILSGQLEQQVIAFLEEEAAARDVRMLLVTPEDVVRYDSAETFAAGAQIQIIKRQPLLARGPATPGLVLRGQFRDLDGDVWLFVAQPLLPTMDAQPQGLHLVVAEPEPHPSLGQVFEALGEEFFAPLTQAGLFGLLVALGLSLVIARSVARPLQRMSTAAQGIAEGNFDQRAPVQGPHEVQSLATTFNEMAARVSLSQQAQRDFLANVSHDLRTPLTSIQGFSQAIAEGVASDPEAAQRAAQVIHDEAARMHRMVENLLDMARIEAGRLDMQRQAVQIGELLQAVGESLSVKAEEQDIELVRDVPDTLPRIAGDGDRLAQVFTNLLDNAIKHTPTGGTVRLRAQADTDFVEVQVRDTGEGIPSADLPRIFERFYQVDKSRHPRAGTGLGLAITRQIVEAHGGTVQVASKEGEGSIFTVWLPVTRPDMPTVVARR